jgi:biopolymer transport protein ExbD
MTPMVDVVMVILIFFMASAAMLGPEWFLNSRVARPDGPAAPTQEQRTRFEVALAMRDGAVAATVDEETLTLTSLLKRIRTRAQADGPSSVVVVVIPEPDVPYDAVVRIHEACAAIGISAVGIGTR